jgi:hypothetical protein
MGILLVLSVRAQQPPLKLQPRCQRRNSIDAGASVEDGAVPVRWALPG